MRGREKTGLCQFRQSAAPPGPQCVLPPCSPAPASQAVPSRPAGVVREAGRVPRPRLGGPEGSGWPALKGCLSQGLGQGWVGMGVGAAGAEAREQPPAGSRDRHLDPESVGSLPAALASPGPPGPLRQKLGGYLLSKPSEGDPILLSWEGGQEPVQWPAGARTSWLPLGSVWGQEAALDMASCSPGSVPPLTSSPPSPARVAQW